MDDHDFDEFVNKCYEEMEQKQKILFEEYNIGTFESYWLEGETRILEFKSNDIAQIKFKVVYIGTWAHIRKTWMWSWFNESLTDEIRTESTVLKALKERTGYDMFCQNGFECDEEMAYELVAMALNQLNALGMYRIPGDRSHLYLALIKLYDTEKEKL